MKLSHWLGWLRDSPQFEFASLWVSGNLASIRTELTLGPSPTIVR